MPFHVLSETQGDMFDNLVQELPCIIFIKMDGCYHCDQMDGDWNKLEGLMNEQPLQKDNFHLIKVNSRAKMKSPCVQGVRGYPTIRSVHKGKTHSEFKGQRTTEELQKFIVTSLKAIEKLNTLNSELKSMNSKNSKKMRLTGGGRKKSKRRHNRSQHNRSRHRRSRHNRSRHRRTRHRRTRHRRTRHRSSRHRRTRHRRTRH